MTDWLKSYNELVKHPPEPGTVLGTESGRPGRLNIEFPAGRTPFPYAIAFVPSVVGSHLGWFLRDIDDEEMYGIKCILLPKSWHKILREQDITTRVVPIDHLRVIRATSSGQALICESYTGTQEQQHGVQ